MNVQFVMFKENGERKDFALHNQTTLVGRKEDCDIRIPLKEVSRQHAEINITRNGVRVKDLGSANGIYVNNKRVKEKDLSPGDHLVIGPVVFTVQIDGMPKDIRPVKTKLRRKTVFSPEDDLTAGLPTTDEKPSAKSGSAPSMDSEVLRALEESESGGSSSLHIDFDEFDLGDSAVVDDQKGGK